jgi:hypothetical protein
MSVKKFTEMFHIFAVLSLFKGSSQFITYDLCGPPNFLSNGYRKLFFP